MTKTGRNKTRWPKRVLFTADRDGLFSISEPKVSEKKKLMEKIKEKENRLKKKQEELKQNLQDEVYQIVCHS